MDEQKGQALGSACCYESQPPDPGALSRIGTAPAAFVRSH